ncbi:hypothetical protein B0H10DRAFT_2434847 [Mycena sp. CBHHK59/15]|nr:hypothetical protein B0H10DRAFT_2434847 [Mycena sp. CBHHK59/15]
MRGQELRADTGCTKAELWLIDLADFASVADSVRRFADKFEQEGGRLDIHRECGDHEPKDAGNVLATSLTVLLLLPQMLRTAREHAVVPRVVVVSTRSDLYYFYKIPDAVLGTRGMLGTLRSEAYCTPKVMPSQYFLAKLLTVFFGRAHWARAARRQRGEPRLLLLGAAARLHGVAHAVSHAFECPTALTTEEGSWRLVWVALSDVDACGGTHPLRAST